MTDDELTTWRLQQLEDSQKVMAKGLADISENLVKINTWGRVALLIHPVFVGIIVAVAVRIIP